MGDIFDQIVAAKKNKDIFDEIATKKKSSPAFVTVDGAGGVIEAGNADTLRNVVKPVPALAAAQTVTGFGGAIQQLGEDPVGYIKRHSPGGAIQTALSSAFGIKQPSTAIGPNRVSKFGEDIAEQGKMVQQQIEQEHPLDPKSFAYDARNAMSTTYAQLPFMLSGGMAAKGLVAKVGEKAASKMAAGVTLAPMGIQTEGATYHERRAAGFDTSASGMSAMADGFIEVITEELPTARVLLGASKVLKMGTKKLVEQFLKYSGEEHIGEGIATFLQSMNAKYMSDSKLPHEERIRKVEEYFTSGEWLQDQISTARSTFVQNLLMGGMAKGAHAIARTGGRALPEEDQPRRASSDIDVLAGDLPEDPQHAAMKAKVDEIFKRHGAASPYADQAVAQPQVDEGEFFWDHNFPETALNQFSPTGSRENIAPQPALGDVMAAVYGQEPMSRDLFDWQNMQEDEATDLLNAMATGREQSVNRRYGYPQQVEAEVVPQSAVGPIQIAGPAGPVYDAQWTHANQIPLNRAGVQIGQPYNPDLITPEVIPPAQPAPQQPGTYDAQWMHANQIPQAATFGAREALNRAPDTIVPVTDITPGFTTPTRNAPRQTVPQAPKPLGYDDLTPVAKARADTLAEGYGMTGQIWADNRGLLSFNADGSAYTREIQPGEFEKPKAKPGIPSEVPPPELERQGISITTGAKGKVTGMEKNGKAARRTPDNKWRVYEGGAVIDVDTQQEAVAFLNRKVAESEEQQPERGTKDIAYHKNKKGETIAMEKGSASAKLDKATGKWTTFDGKTRIEDGLEKEEAEDWIRENQEETDFAVLSTRVPTAVSAREDPLSEILSIDSKVMFSDEETLAKNASLLMTLPNMKKRRKGESLKSSVKAFIAHVAKNLLFLHDQMKPEWRERARLWYDGGHKIVSHFAKRYGISNMQAAAVIAVLSPQNDWFENVSQAERVMDAVFAMRDFRWDDAMTAEADRWEADQKASKEKAAAKGTGKGYSPDAEIPNAKGKTLGEVLDSPAVAARWIRFFDQAHNNRGFRVLTPEGGSLDYSKTGAGSNAIMRWKTFPNIAKAVSILNDGRAENVFYQLDEEHKVRNFYNNLFDPNSKLGFTTTDTHAVAAGLLQSLSGEDPEVLHTFGRTGSSSGVTGLRGTYPIYMEAYKQAGKERNLLPREMQSITREAVRGLFQAASKKRLRPLVKAVWQQYKDGLITQEQAQQEIFDLAGGITAPAWVGYPSDGTFTSTYEGPAREKIKDVSKAVATGKPADVYLEVAPDPSDKELAAEWRAVPFKDRVEISHKIAAKMIPKILEEAGTSGSVSMQIGGYLGETNPAISLSVEDLQLAMTVTKLCGFAFSQQEMMMVSPVPVAGAKAAGVVTIELPEGYGFKEISALYDKLWTIEHDGKKLVRGHSTANGQMAILNDKDETGVDADTLASIIDKHLDGHFKVGTGTAYVASPRAKDYNYASDKKHAVETGSPISRRGHRLQAESTRLLREALDGRRAAASRKQTSVDGRRASRANRDERADAELPGYHPSKQPAGGGRIAKVLPVREDGRIVVHHYSRGARDVLSTHFVGTGIEGAEKKKRERLGDVYMNPIYTAIPGRYDTEEALRSVNWRHDVSIPPEKLYDWQRADEDGLLSAAKEKSVAARGGISDEAHIEWTANRMLREAGYWGVYNSLEKGQQAIVLLWESVTPEEITNVVTGEVVPSKGVTTIPENPPAPKPTKKDPGTAQEGVFDVSSPEAVAALAQVLKDQNISFKGYKLYNNTSPEYYQSSPEILGAIAGMGYQSVNIAGETIPVSGGDFAFTEHGVIDLSGERGRVTKEEFALMARGIEMAVGSKNVRIEFPERIGVNPKTDTGKLAAHGRTPESKGHILGTQRVVHLKSGEMFSLIRIATAHPNKLWTLWHELMHASEKLGIINEKDIKILANAFPSIDGGKNSTERRADAMGDYAIGQLKGVPPAVHGVFKKVKDFLVRLQNAFRGLGFRNAEDVMRDLMSGKLKEQAAAKKAPQQVDTTESYALSGLVSGIRNLPPGAFKRALGVFNPMKTPHYLHEVAGFVAPTQVVKFFNDNFATPLFYAERNPEVAEVVENAWQRQSESFALKAKFHEFTDANGNQKTLKDLHSAYKKLDKPQRKQFSRLLVMGDALSKEYATLQDAQQDVLGITPQAFSHYQEFREFVRSIFPKAREEILENQLEKYNRNPQLKEVLRQLIQSGGGLTQAQTDAILLDAYMDLKGLKFIVPEYQKKPWFNDLANLMGYSVNAAGDVTWGKPVDIKQLKVNPQQFAGKISQATLVDPKLMDGLLAAYKDVVDNKRVDRAVKRAAEDVVTARKSLTDLKKTFNAINGWMPRMREDGNYRVEVYALDANGDPTRLVYVDFRDSRLAASVLQDQITANPQKFYGINMSQMPGVQFSEPQISEDSKRLPESIYADRATDISTEQLIEAAISKMRDKYGMDQDQYDDLRDAVMKAAADRILARGAGAHKLKRAPYLIEGYETEDPYYTIGRYIGGLSGFLSKGRYAIRQMQALSDITSKSHKDWAYTYIKNTLKNAGKADQYGATIRALATIWFLGLRVSSAIFNATQNAVYGQAELSRYTKNPMAEFAAAYRDLGLDKAAKVKGKQTLSLTLSEKAAIQDAIKRGAIHETIVGDQIGKGEGFKNKAGRMLDKATDIVMYPFQFVEQYINREPAFLAAYRVFAKKNPGFRPTQQQPYDPVAFKAALEFVNKVHFLPGKANLPRWAHNAFGRTAYTLMSYVANSFNWMYNRSTSGEKDQVIAVLRMLAAVSLIGGVGAIPILGDDFWKLIRSLFKVDFKAEMEKSMREATEDYSFSEPVIDAIFHGLPSFAGINVTNAVTMRIPLLSNLLAGDDFIESATGAVGGLARKVWKGAGSALEGEIYRAAEYAAPEAVSGVMRSYRMATEGATTGSGKTLYGPDQKPVKYTAGDVVKRTLGFQPMEHSKLAEVKDLEYYYKDVYGNKKKAASKKARNLLRDKDVAGALKTIIEFNKMIVGSPAKTLVPPFKDLGAVFEDSPDKKEAAFFMEHKSMLGDRWDAAE